MVAGLVLRGGHPNPDPTPNQDTAEAAKARATVYAKLLEDRVLKELEISQMW